MSHAPAVVQTSLLRVKELNITFLVDNAIEWMHRFPPGFSNELTMHMERLPVPPPFDDVTGVPFLDLENYCCGAHGFSALIQTKVDESTPIHTILFDTGPDSRSIIRNIEAMQVPIDKVERVVLSHWHSDHSGGLLSFLRYRKRKLEETVANSAVPQASPIIVDLHPDRPMARGIAISSKVLCRLPRDPEIEEIQALCADVELYTESHTVAGNTIFISGEIPRVTAFEKGLPSGVRWVQNGPQWEWKQELQIMDERYTAVDVVGKGLVIFSACSHAGIANVILDAVKTLERPVYMVVGGLHLGGSELQERIAPTVDFLVKRLRPAPTYVLPMHCSGFGVKVALEEALGEGCVPGGVGLNIRVQGDVNAEESLFPPVVG